MPNHWIELPAGRGRVSVRVDGRKVTLPRGVRVLVPALVLAALQASGIHCTVFKE